MRGSRSIRKLSLLLLSFLFVTFLCIPTSLRGSPSTVAPQQRSHREPRTERAGSTARTPEEFPRFSVGLSSFALVYDDGLSEYEFEGFAAQSTSYLNRNLALRGRFYNTENDYNEEISGLDLTFLIGTNWGEGFNLFGGVGFYTEDFETPEIYEALGIDLGDDSWSGYMLSAGIGYQWEHGSLELGIDARDSSDLDSYKEQDPVIKSVDGAYASGALSIEYIF